jgi:hypothetical protein
MGGPLFVIYKTDVMKNILNYLSSELSKEAKKVEDFFHKECEVWVSRKLTCKLIILGEAPLTREQFFYNKKTGRYLDFLKQHYTKTKKLKDDDYREFLRTKGILNLDIYQYPLPTNFYDNDKKLILFDSNFINSKIKSLEDEGIITPSTNFVYRYKKLIDRKIHSSLQFSSYFSGVHIKNEPIAIGRYATKINPNLKKYLP